MRIGGRPSRQFVAGHGVRAHIALPQSGLFDLAEYHAFDTADIGERDPRMLVQQRLKLA